MRADFDGIRRSEEAGEEPSWDGECAEGMEARGRSDDDDRG